MRNALAALSILLAQILLLYLLGRNWICPCGNLLLWQATPDPAQNSQHVSDPYSLLHMAFGFGLFIWLKLIRPHWPLSQRALTALAGSAIWEAIENTPAIIHYFGTEASARPYPGDSIVNSVSDTLFVMLAFYLASRMPVKLVVAMVVVIELSVYSLIGDGLLIGTFRFVAGA